MTFFQICERTTQLENGVHVLVLTPKSSFLGTECVAFNNFSKDTLRSTPDANSWRRFSYPSLLCWNALLFVEALSQESSSQSHEIETME
jgi:hypothetical protein